MSTGADRAAYPQECRRESHSMTHPDSVAQGSFDGDPQTSQTDVITYLLVLDANPLENIRNTNAIRYVMKNARVYDGNTLAERWPRQRAVARQW